MGNADIRDIAVIDEVEIDTLSGSTVAVDAPNWLYKYMTTTTQFRRRETFTASDGTELPNLIGVPQGVKKFVENDIIPVFVFDGAPHEMKAKEIEERRQKRKSAAQKAAEAENREEKARYRARSQQMNTAIIESTKELFDRFDIAYCTAPRAAEAQTAHMAQSEAFDYALSDDYDSVLFGAPSTLRNFTSSSSTAEQMSLEETLSEHTITQKDLVNAAIMCETDYNDGIRGIGPKTSIKLVTKHDSMETILDKKDESVENLEAIQQLFLDPPVTDSWAEPTEPAPDTERVREYLESNGIDTSNIESTLDAIDKASFQRGLGSFGE